MNAIGTGLGHLIGLALIPAALIWVLRGTRPGRLVWDVCARARRRHIARQEQQRHHQMVQAHTWWTQERDWWRWYQAQHGPGTPPYELAHTILGNIELRRPPCPHTGFTCPDPTCPNHLRRHQP